MRISDLVTKLQNIEAEHGDMDVRFFGTLSEDDDDDTVAIAGVALHCDEYDQPVGAIICDDLTLDGFIDSSDLG